MSDRAREYDTAVEAMNAATILWAHGVDVWVHPQHRTAPVEHDVWIVTVRS